MFIGVKFVCQAGLLRALCIACVMIVRALVLCFL